jgi:hypothetical protein
MLGAIPPLPYTFSWRGAYLNVRTNRASITFILWIKFMRILWILNTEFVRVTENCIGVARGYIVQNLRIISLRTRRRLMTS